MKLIKVAIASTALALGSATAHAGYVTLDLSSIVNSDIADYTNGYLYPAPGPTTIGDIPFVLTSGFDGFTWVAGGLASIGVPQSYSISGLDLQHVTSMYALVNSAFGSCGSAVGSIGAQTATGSQSYTLTEGVNVRDHYNGGFCNAQTDAIATAEYGGGVRFDAYQFDLSALTNNGQNSLTEFDFSSFGLGGAGEPLLAAVTFTTVPEPSMLALMSLGLMGLGYVRRRKTA